MTVISNLYYSGIANSKDITDVFDFENFLDHTKINGILTNFKEIDNFLKSMLDTFDTTNQNIVTFVNEAYIAKLRDTCYYNSFVKIIASTPSNFSTTDAAQVAFLKTKVEEILNTSIDWSDLDTIRTQLVNLPDAAYQWGASFKAFAQAFDMAKFKEQIVSALMTSHYPYIYYKHIMEKSATCADFKCKRAYILCKYVFVYYTFMTLFLAIFSNAETVVAFKSANAYADNDTLSNLKYRMVLVMDKVLAVLQEENLLDNSGATGVSNIMQYYETLKTLSDNNVVSSNTLNERRKIAGLMQNNLSNYNHNEATAAATYARTRVIFWVTVGIMSLVMLYLYSLTAMQNWAMLFFTATFVMIILLGVATTAFFKPIA